MTVVDLQAVMPLLFIAAGALVVLLAGAVKREHFGTPAGIAALLAAALWCLRTPETARTAIGFTLSPFARFFNILFALTGVAVLLLSRDYNERREVLGEEYPATVLFAVFGLAVLSGATNLLILFLGLEGLTFAFYFLVAIDRQRPEAGEAGLKYLLMGAVAAAFTAFGIALLYAGSGALETAPVMNALAAAGASPLLLAGAGFLLAGIAFKISLVPAHLWTPDVYEGATAPVAAFLATASKGGAIVFLLLLLSVNGVAEPLRVPLWTLSALSMVVGNLAALRQRNLKRMLAYSAIAQMGYVTLALLAGKGGGFSAAAFYLVAYTAMNLAAFGAVTSLTTDREPGGLDEYRGIGYTRPFQAGVLALAMFALAGIPPTAGFMGKFFIFAAALRAGETSLAVIGILSAVVSVYYYLRVVVTLYMHPVETEPSVGGGTLPETVSLTAAAFFLLALGVLPAPLMDLLVSFLS